MCSVCLKLPYIQYRINQLIQNEIQQWQWKDGASRRRFKSMRVDEDIVSRVIIVVMLGFNYFKSMFFVSVIHFIWKLSRMIFRIVVKIFRWHFCSDAFIVKCDIFRSICIVHHNELYRKWTSYWAGHWNCVCHTWPHHTFANTTAHLPMR